MSLHLSPFLIRASTRLRNAVLALPVLVRAPACACVQAAREAGNPDWGYGGPHDAGDYCSSPEDTEFFSQQGSWDTQYGR